MRLCRDSNTSVCSSYSRAWIWSWWCYSSGASFGLGIKMNLFNLQVMNNRNNRSNWYPYKIYIFTCKYHLIFVQLGLEFHIFDLQVPYSSVSFRQQHRHILLSRPHCERKGDFKREEFTYLIQVWQPQMINKFLSTTIFHTCI